MAVQCRLWLAMCFAAGLCGCTVGPDYQFPEVAVPALFGSASRELVTQETAPQPEPVLWWQTLHDPVITRLVEQAIACNLDIEIALTRMQAVRTQQIVVVGTALPTVEASGRHRRRYRHRPGEGPRPAGARTRAPTTLAFKM